MDTTIEDNISFYKHFESKRNDLVKLYNTNSETGRKVYTDKDLSEKLSVSERTIRRWLLELRKEKVIGYRNKNTETIVNDLPENLNIAANNQAKITKLELLKLFALYKTKAQISRETKISVTTITRLCQEYNIMDEDSRILLLTDRLKTVLNTPYKYLNIKKPVLGHETIAMNLSDWHVGPEVKNEKNQVTYNPDIFEERINRFIHNLLSLIDNHVKINTKLNRAVMFASGDFADSSGIYPEQELTQLIIPPYQTLKCTKALVRIIKELLKRDLIVEFYGVPGNHSKTNNYSYRPNWDLMVYLMVQFWAEETKPKNFKMNYTEGDFLNCNVFDWNYHVRHNAPVQAETAAGRAKFAGWQSMHEADAIVYGHYHHYGITDNNGATLFRNGSIKGPDDLSESMGVGPATICQQVWGITKKRVMSFFYATDLKED